MRSICTRISDKHRNERTEQKRFINGCENGNRLDAHKTIIGMKDKTI